MEFTAQQIAELIKGRVEGDKDAKVSSFAKIEEGHERDEIFSCSCRRVLGIREECQLHTDKSEECL